MNKILNAQKEIKGEARKLKIYFFNIATVLLGMIVATLPQFLEGILNNPPTWWYFAVIPLSFLLFCLGVCIFIMLYACAKFAQCIIDRVTNNSWSSYAIFLVVLIGYSWVTYLNYGPTFLFQQGFFAIIAYLFIRYNHERLGINLNPKF